MRAWVLGGVRPYVLALAAFTPVLVAGRSDSAERPKVVATTVQITALTTAVTGDLVDLKGIIPAGVDPHEFEPTASDLVAIEGQRSSCGTGSGSTTGWTER